MGGGPTPWSPPCTFRCPRFFFLLLSRHLSAPGASGVTVQVWGSRPGRTINLLQNSFAKPAGDTQSPGSCSPISLSHGPSCAHGEAVTQRPGVHTGPCSRAHPGGPSGPPSRAGCHCVPLGSLSERQLRPGASWRLVEETDGLRITRRWPWAEETFAKFGAGSPWSGERDH